MNMLRLLLLLGLLLVLALAGASCSGGGDDDGDTTPPPLGGGDGGDDDEDPPVGSGGNFLPGGVGQYQNLRGVAVSREFVYIADQNTLYCFDKRGAEVNRVTLPEIAQGLSIFPPTLAQETRGTDSYFLANCPVVLHNPVTGVGYIRIYPPGLDPAATREDEGNPDFFRFQSLPPDPAQISPSGVCLLTTCFQATNVYDIKVDRHASIITMADVAICCPIPPNSPIPDRYPRTLQVMNRFDDYRIAEGGIRDVENQQGEVIQASIPGYHRYDGFPFGDRALFPGEPDDTFDVIADEFVNLGTLAVDNLYPPLLTGSSYQVYLGSSNFFRDYVGVAEISVQELGVTVSYGTSAPVQNGYGYSRIIGGPPGLAPGSFDPNPPTDGNGNLIDADLTNGGPSGMCVDPRNNDVYVCDPGNARVQVFNEAGDLTDIIVDAGGAALIAPSEVAVDYDGNVFICDVGFFRRLAPVDVAYGGISGRVRNPILDIALPGSLIQLRNETGTIEENEVANINGEYRFDNLPVGDYFLSASKFNYHPDIVPTAVRVVQDQTVQVNFNLTPRSTPNLGAYVGTVSNSVTNLPVEFVDVEIVGTSLAARTDITGRFQIIDIAPGTYQVLFSRDGFETVTKDVTILQGNTTTDNFINMTPIL